MRHQLNFSLFVVAVVTWAVSACGGGSEPSIAQTSNVVADAPLPGTTPFVSFLTLRGAGIGSLSSLRYTIAPKPGHLSKPVSASFSAEYLLRRGYAVLGQQKLTLPVVGLYPGYRNDVGLIVTFMDGSTTSLTVPIQAAAYADPTMVYDSPHIVTPRVPGKVLGYDFFYMKSYLGPPVVLDTDGEIRWAAPAATVPTSVSSLFVDEGFSIGSLDSTQVVRLELDGTSTATSLTTPTFTNFHHTIDPGKFGMMAGVDATIDGQKEVENVLAEFNAAGVVTGEWDLGAILSSYMKGAGDDPATFVWPGVDWFHMNSAVYDPRDDSLVVSSRENFIIDIAYATGEIRWIFGDPEKYWYTFPSLRAKALAMPDGAFFPIGQHALSINPQGLLMLFNNGQPSSNEPAGEPEGASRTYSAVSAYSIDATAGTAREVWRFDNGQTLKSPFCSSAYQSSDGSTLINYAMVNNTTARLVGLDPMRQVVFDFEYPSAPCIVSWNAAPIPFDDLRFE